MTTPHLEKISSTAIGAVDAERPRSRRDTYERNRTLAAFDEAADLDITTIRFWNQDVVLVNREDLIHDVLVTQADAFRKGPLLTRNARPVLGKGLLTSDNELNRKQRRIISPAFAHRKIPEYADLVVEQTLTSSSEWASGDVLDVTTAILAITLRITDRLLFGAEHDTDGDSILGSLPILMNFAIDQLRSPLRAASSLPRALAALIQLNRSLGRRIRARQRRGAPRPDDETDLLDTLLFGHGPGAEGVMPRSLVRDEAMTTFLAGLETVAMAISWSLFLLAKHPEIASRARDEVDVLSHSPNFDDLARLPLTLHIFKEALRLYPPVYILARQAVIDADVGENRLRRGAVVFVSPYLRQRRADLFKDPLRFDPDRWSPPNFERSLPRYSFLPFGGGQHVCVGGHFALMQGHLILATLLQGFRFDLEPAQTIVPEPLFTLRPRDGIRMRVTRR